MTADELDIHAKTVRRWCRNDGAPCDRTPNGDYLLDPGEMLLWMKATGRTGKPGRPDAVEKTLREERVGLPREVVPIEPARLRAIFPNCSNAMNLLTLPQAEMACEVWAEAWERYLLHWQGKAEGEAAGPMPLHYWRDEIRKMMAEEKDEHMDYIQWSLMRYLAATLGAERMLAAMPCGIRQEVRRWLTGKGKRGKK
jgi:hypothetical protein